VITGAWEWWKQTAQKIGNFQARALLTVCYVVLMFPFGMAVRLFFDPLRIKQRPTRWSSHPEEMRDWRWARRQ
jgi:hypothetical protein